MAKFRLVIDIDNANTWMRSEFSLGIALKNIGKNIINGNPNFQKMFKGQQEIKDAYGNVVGYYEMTP